jgi:hypothetical protein
MVVTLGHISHIWGNWKHRPKPHGAADGANRSREILGNHSRQSQQAGWSWGCVATVDSNGRTIFVANAHRDDGKRFVVHADQKLTAFGELESAIRGCSELLDKLAGFLPNSTIIKRILN